jgi:hypothetical protein
MQKLREPVKYGKPTLMKIVVLWTWICREYTNVLSDQQDTAHYISSEYAEKWLTKIRYRYSFLAKNTIC